MNEQHILSLLESTPFNRLNESELARARAHTENCAECRQAMAAARISSLLLTERSAETFAPSPFFQTRVLAALREQQAANETPSLWRLWKTAGALVYSLVMVVALLGILTFVSPQAPANGGAAETSALTADSYTTEEVMLAQGGGSGDESTLTYDQVLSTIYEKDTDEAR